MPAVRNQKYITDKYGRVTPAKAAEYKAGVKNTKKDWSAEVSRPEVAIRQKEGVDRAFEAGLYGKRVAAVPQAEFVEACDKKGSTRYRGGVEYGLKKYDKNFAPFRDVIERTTLPPKGPKGDPENYRRVEVMGTALHDEKVK